MATGHSQVFQVHHFELGVRLVESYLAGYGTLNTEVWTSKTFGPLVKVNLLLEVP